MNRTIHTSFTYVTIAVFIAVLLPTLFTEGMFMDGLLYSTVSKNLSQGTGTWWHPCFSETYMKDFHEQPPFMFWLESFFFRLLGTAFWVERIYNLILAVIIAFVIARVWKMLFPEGSSLRQFAWLSVLVWITVPGCNFVFINNLEEGTLSLFGLLSIYMVTAAMKRTKPIYMLLFMGGLMTFLSILTKGIQGAFPLTAVFFYWLSFRSCSFKEMIKGTALLISIPLVLLLLLATNSSVSATFHSYYEGRLLTAFNSASLRTTGNHFNLLFILFINLTPAAALTLIVSFAGKMKWPEWLSYIAERRLALFFLLVGLSASLPLMVTLEQRSFYLVTSYPYFSLCFSLLMLPALQKLFGRISIQSKTIKALIYMSVATVIISIYITILDFGKVKRNAAVFKDVKVIAAQTQSNAIIGVSGDLCCNWEMRGYLERYYNISLDMDHAESREYFLTIKDHPAPVDTEYIKGNVTLDGFNLYKRKRL